MTDHATPPAGMPRNWVPVDRRFLGLDRRTILPAAIVLAFVYFCTTGLPGISNAVDYDNPTRAGALRTH